MQRLVLCIALICVPHVAFALSALICAGPVDNKQCFAAVNYSSQEQANQDALRACFQYFGQHANEYCSRNLSVFQAANMCSAVADYQGHSYVQNGSTPEEARNEALNACDKNLTGPCKVLLTFCDGSAAKVIAPSLISTLPPASHEPPTTFQRTFSPAFDLIPAIVSSTLAALIILLLFAFRTSIINFVVQGNLPTKLPVYGEDIQVLFQRTQRLNWYGRVVFGVIARLAMTHQQLADVRKYWLGRVVAFDSLRRRRQNELARMHLQLAATVKGETKGKTLLSQFLTMLKVLFLFVFYLFRALFSFLFGFLFIRVTIAKLVRGTLIESKDLVLVLQAKQAVEDSTKYLREYLVTANTFDGREEMFDTE